MFVPKETTPQERLIRQMIDLGEHAMTALAQARNLPDGDRRDSLLAQADDCKQRLCDALYLADSAQRREHELEPDLIGLHLQKQQVQAARLLLDRLNYLSDTTANHAGELNRRSGLARQALVQLESCLKQIEG